MVSAFRDHLYKVHTWLNSQPNVKVHRVPYHEVLSGPRVTAEKLAQFLQIELDVEAMVRQVDGTLYRQRKK